MRSETTQLDIYRDSPKSQPQIGASTATWCNAMGRHLSPSLREAADTIRALLAERDALLSALEGVMYYDNCEGAWLDARAAIAAANGGGDE